MQHPNMASNTLWTEYEDDNPMNLPALRHPTLYMASGDVVLSTENNGVVNLFRVHKTTLSYHSPIFQDMFTLPPSSVNEMYDGVPVVQMQDSFEELVSFLEVLYGIEHTRMKRYHPDAALATMGALKLIAKYQTDYVRDRLVRHIEADWPKSPMEWIAAYRTRQAYLDTNEFHGELAKNEPLERRFPEPASAIRLAIDCDVPSILPAAFLELADIKDYSDWDNPQETEETLQFNSRSARWNLLDELEGSCLVQGRAKLLLRCEDLRASVLTIPANICQGDFLDCQAELAFRRGKSREPDCGATALKSYGATTVLDSWPKPSLGTSNPMLILQEMDDALRDWSLCAQCCKRVRQNIAREMQECWAELPETFNLPEIPTSRL